MCCHGFILDVDALQKARINTLICQRLRCLSFAFSAGIIRQISSPFSRFFSAGLPLLTAALWHQFICPVVGPGPFLRVVPPTQKKRYGQLNSTHTSGFCFSGRRFTYPLFLAYECCRFKSKSFSRFLLCSLLQTSPSPCISSSPSSSCLLWVLVGWSEQVCTVNFKSRFFILVEFFALLFYIYIF